MLIYCSTTIIFLLQQYASGAWKNCPFHFRHEVPIEEYDYHLTICEYKVLCKEITGKNNRFPFLDILGYLKNTHKNPKFGRVRQVPIWELSWEFLVGTCLTLPNLGFLWVFFKYPNISKNGNPSFFPVNKTI